MILAFLGVNMKELLFKYQDLKYKEFHLKLMPGINDDRVIGVRVPQIKRIASQIQGTEKAKEFLCCLPHEYYEENNIHCCLISSIKDFDSCLLEVERFLPYINNWATCDILRPKALKQEPQKLMDKILLWLKSDKEYTVRFAIEMLMVNYLDKYFSEDHLYLVASIRSEKYYINMMIAWYFAEALCKQYDYAIKILERKKLSVWCHNKTIQKAIDSFRITKETKEYLRSLRIK